jgi:hypothetical protein
MAHGFTVQGGLGAAGSIIPHESSAHSVLVPDTELLFTAQFHRAGPDLVLTGRDGAHHLIPGYFASEHHPALVAPNGAHLSPDTVDLLAGSPTPGHYAQAQPTAPPDSIGKIEKVVGDVTVVRNGATVALHVGDAVFKSDVVQTGAGASCGISFPDGTALNLVANTRMALNDYAYDAGSNSNGALFTLVEGTFAFVAGKVAHSGDMKIATPVATMGIRGTTGVVEEQAATPATITAQAGGHTYTFAVLPDIGTGITGVWDCYLTDAQGNIVRDANGNPIVLATIAQSGFVTYFTPQGLGQPPLVTTEPVTDSQYAFEQEMLGALASTLNLGNLHNNNNGSSTPPPPFELPNPLPQLFEDNGKPFTINVPNGSNPTTPTIIDIVIGPTAPTGPPAVIIWIASGNGPWNSGPSWLYGGQPSSPHEVVIPAYKVTTVGADSAAGLVVENNPPNSPPGILNIVSGTSFTIYDYIHGNGTIQLNASGSDPTLFIDGAVPLVGGGTIDMIGTAGENFILGVPGTGALLLNIDYTIEGTGTIGGGDGNLTFQNFGTVNANDGLLTINTGNQVYNDGLMEATSGGTLAIQDSVANAGTVQADGSTAAVTLSGATFDNLFSVVAENGGSITFTNVAVTNEAISTTDPAGGTINANGGTIAFNGGSLANDHLLEATNGGTLQLENLTVNNSAAATASVDATSTADLMAAAILGGTIENDGKVVVTDGASVLHGDSVTNDGTMTVEAGASLKLEGDTALINDAGALIKADGGTVAIELDTDSNVNSGTIEAVNGGKVDFYINVDGGSNQGLIEAGAGGTVHFFQTHGGGGGGGGAQGGNYGTMEAKDGGILIFDGGLDNFDHVDALNGGLVYLNEGIKNHAGTVEACGDGSQISISNGGDSENADTIIAKNDGVISLASVMLTNDANAMIEATSGGSISWITGGIDNSGTFDADGGTITFGGSIGITNEGTGIFEASDCGSITFATSGIGSVSNDGGMIVACGGGTITFDSSLNGVENNDGGVIAAGANGTVNIDGFEGGNGVENIGGYIEANGANATVNLFGANINGGTLETSACGVIVAATGTSIFLNVTATDGTVIQVDDGAVLNLLGGLGGPSNPALTIDGTVTLQGGADNTGIVEIDVPSYFIAAGAGGGTLDNATTIEGAGQIGAGAGDENHLTLDNLSGGTIDADVYHQLFVLDTDATVSNAGTLEATCGGTLSIADNVDNTGTIKAEGDGRVFFGTEVTIDNTCGVIEALTHGTVDIGSLGDKINNRGGLIQAVGCGAVVMLDCVVNGGVIGSSNGGVIEALGGTLNGVNILGGSDLVTFDGPTVDLQGTTTLDGTVTFGGAGGLGGFTLIGCDAQIVSACDTDTTLVNLCTISGAGVIGDAHMTLDNESGFIFADVSGATLTIDTGCNQITNGGTLVSLAGTLAIESSLDNYGDVAASGDGHVCITSNVLNESSGQFSAEFGGTITVINDCFTNAGGGGISASDGGTITFSGDHVINDCNGSISTFLGGAINFDHSHLDNYGQIDPSGGNITFCHSTVDNYGQLNGVVFNGIQTGLGGDSGGVITFDCSDVVNSGYIGAAFGSITFDDSCVSNSDGISNGGNGIVAFEGGSVTFDHSEIDNTGFIGAFTSNNDGGAGTIYIDDSTVHNACGIISAVGEGDTVRLDHATVMGGELQGSGGGVIEVVSSDCPSVLDGSCSAVSISALVQVDAGAALDLVGTIHTGGEHDSGTINLAQNGYGENAIGADLQISGTVCLDGGGAVTLFGSADEITAASCGAELDNRITISGAGHIGTGDNALTLVNSGLINADDTASRESLTIETGCNTIVNHGTMEATFDGRLDICSSVDNCGGTLAVTSGSVLDVHSSISGGSATIQGGTLEFDSSSNVNVTFNNGPDCSPTYGTLVINDPSDFSGQITGFTGTCPDAAHSDTIDLAGFNACDTSLRASYDCHDGITTLCVVDTTDHLSATLKLVGQYSTGNFTIASDGKGGIDIFDPPTTGATDAPATATTAAGNDHVGAPVSENGSDHAAGPANEAAFGGDQSPVVTSNITNGGDTASGTNELAPASSALALGSGLLAGATSDAAFGGDQAGVAPASEADAGTLANGLHGGSTLTLLSSLLNVLTGDDAGASFATSASDGDNGTAPAVAEGSGAANSAVTLSTLPMAPINEHVAAPALATAPTLASATFGAVGNDSFAFHPNFGSDTAQTAGAQTNELAHNSIQVAAPAPASMAPMFHAEFALDVIHQDDTHVAATVDQFHQMAVNTTLLH